MSVVLVSGAIANKHLIAGEAWHRLHWVLGLRRLGFTVYFVEQISPKNCLDAHGTCVPLEESVNLVYLKTIAKDFGWTDSAILISDDGQQISGMSYSELLDLAADAELLINISGHLTLPALLSRPRCKVYIDEDPGFTQFWHASDASSVHLDGHDFYFTLGANICWPDCVIPTGGIPWRPTRPFVVLDQWPVSPLRDLASGFTTIASWRGPYGPVEVGENTYGLKVHEFRKFLTLPHHCSHNFELALNIDPADARDSSLLDQHGWRVVDPRQLVPDPQAYRLYIQKSGAEFSVAKGLYVDTRSGWFSDRTVRYLASGKPALVQDTGFGKHYPVGLGLVPFRTLEDASTGADHIAHNYQAHCRAARALAEEYFDSDKVLGRLLEEVGAAPQTAMSARKQTILVSGMIAGDPHQGGATWSVLQYLVGLARLGHDVYLIEPLAATALLPAGVSLGESLNAAYFRQVCSDFGLEKCAALLLAGTRQTVGLPYEHLCQIAQRADMLLNISGMLVDHELLAHIPVRVYLDLDPAFNQLWQTEQGIDRHFAGHTHFVTVGLALGDPECPVPTCSRAWITTLPPVVLTHWPVAGPITYEAFTTVGNWRGYGSIDYQGVLHGQKAHSLRPLLSLPTRTLKRFRLALAIHAEETRDLEALAVNGWQVLDPMQVAGTPALYRSFLQGSWAEFGLAKSGYVVSRCGWFSDRSACYLACGRPVLAQDTGFSRFLPTGDGLLTFRTVDEALAGIESLADDYPRHARAARALAEEFFDSDKVLTRLLDHIGGAP